MFRITRTLLMLTVLAGALGNAQNVSTSLKGRVVDPTGAAVPAAGISATGAALNTTANAEESEKTFSRNFDTAAFVDTPLGSFGNAGVNILRGPGINNWDISVGKSFPIGLGEKRPLQFRAASFNTFNHTQFSRLDTTARFDARGNQANPSFGAFTGARPGRVIALDLRFRF